MQKIQNISTKSTSNELLKQYSCSSILGKDINTKNNKVSIASNQKFNPIIDKDCVFEFQFLLQYLIT